MYNYTFKVSGSLVQCTMIIEFCSLMQNMDNLENSCIVYFCMRLGSPPLEDILIQK